MADKIRLTKTGITAPMFCEPAAVDYWVNERGWVIDPSDQTPPPPGSQPVTHDELDAFGLAGLADVTTTGAAVDSVLAVTQIDDVAGRVFGFVDPAAPSYPSNSIACFGDSLLYSAEGGTSGIVETRMASVLGVPVSNQGASGQSSTDIAVRQGGVKPLLTAAGNQIPASGPVAVTLVSPTSSFRQDSTSPTYTWVGTLAGVRGTLTHTQTANTWSFTRTTSGAVTACAPSTPFIADSARDHWNKIQVWMAGRNNLQPGGVLMDVARDFLSMKAALRPTHPHYVALSMLNANYESSGGSGYNDVIALNNQLAADHGANYYDIRRDLIDRGLALAGITATAGDTTAIAADRIPPSLMQDTVHPNTAGYQVMGTLIAEFITRKGWLTGVDSKLARPASYPAVTSAVVVDSTGVSSTRSLLDATPTVGQYFYTASSGGTAVAQLSTGTLRVIPWLVRKPITLDRIAAEVTVVGDAGSKVRLGIYADNGHGYPGALVVDGGTINGDSATVQAVTVNTVLPAGLYWIGSVTQVVTTTQPTIRTVAAGWQPPVPISVGTTFGAAGQTGFGYSQFTVTGALPGTFDTGLSASGSTPARTLVRRSA